MSVLITGGSGFLGRHLIDNLQREKQRVTVLARRPELLADEHSDQLAIRGSPLDLPSIKAKEIAGTKTIIHAAAVVKHSRQVPSDLYPLNIDGTLNMVRYAHQLGARLIFISTSGTVGCFRYADIAADEHAPHAERLAGRWPYYRSKIEAEKKARQLAEKLGVELVIVRPPVMLGPGDSDFRSTKHVLSMMRGHVPLIPTGGMHFADVRDVAQAVARLTVLPAVRRVYHFPGTASTLAQFFQMLHEVTGRPLTRRTAPNWVLEWATRASLAVARGVGQQLPQWIPDPVLAEMAGCFWGLSTLWTDRELGYRSRPARQTLSDTVAFIERHHPDFSEAGRGLQS